MKQNEISKTSEKIRQLKIIIEDKKISKVVRCFAKNVIRLSQENKSKF